MSKLVSHGRLLITRTFKGNRTEKSSGYPEKNYIENDLKGNENCFELMGGYKRFELP